MSEVKTSAEGALTLLCWVRDGVRLAVDATRLSSITTRGTVRCAVVEDRDGAVELELGESARLRTFPRGATRALPVFLAEAARRAGLLALVEEPSADDTVYWVLVNPSAPVLHGERSPGGAP